MHKIFGILLVVGFAAMAWAQDENMVVRFRLINVAPNDDSSQILNTGTAVAVDDAIVPEIDLTYMFNKNWGLEVIAATSPHDLST